MAHNHKTFLILILVVTTESFVINNTSEERESDIDLDKETEGEADNVFNGVYTECFLYLSYSCLQKKTLLYLKELDKLSEVSVIGEYVKFVKVNETESEDKLEVKNTEELSFLIDKAVDRFFSNHILKFNAMGKDFGVPQSVEEFVGRKRKGGGGGGGHGGGGGDDGGKKKMMMMAMMCMKMKFMMMIPAMMGMMGMMSFKGMMFSMMSFMLSKMMLLMKLLEKKGGGGSGGGGDGGWAAGGGGGGGAWMPAGGQDGGGGGYDANGQWQSRSIIDNTSEHVSPEIEENKPIISYVTPIVRYNNNVNGKKPFSILKRLNDEVIKLNQDDEKPKSRKKRSIVDVLQNAYLYWINRVLGMNNFKKYHPKYPKFKVMNGVKYVYYPLRQIYKYKTPKELPVASNIKITDAESFKPIITADDFNKGEIVEGPVESRMNKKKMKEFKNTVDEAMEDSPWQ